MMRVAIDAAAWKNSRGYGRYARSLLREVAAIDTLNEYSFFVDWQPSPSELPGGVKVEVVNNRKPTVESAAASSRRSIPDMWRMSRALSRARADLIFFPTVYSYVPVIGRAKLILGIHDIIPERFPHLALDSSKSRFLWKIKVAAGLWQAQGVVTVSEYSRHLLMEQFGLPAEKVFVVSEASDPIFRPIKGHGPLSVNGVPANGAQRFVLYVGGFSPHKNLGSLLRAFHQTISEDGYSTLKLIMVGNYKGETFHSEYEKLQGQIRGMGLSDRVHFTGYLPDEKLVLLMNQADVLVLPSFMEGFGLPAVEAAACGCPVIATCQSPLPDLLGAGGLYIDPHQPGELEAALRKVLDSERVRVDMGDAGKKAAARLTWNAAAKQLLEVFHALRDR